ncbi:MAG: MFS transporter [Anaerolineae bacterium]|jgi:DHA3 family macrolide efflux protein-like MFS transporter
MEKGQVSYGRLRRNRSFMALWLGQTISFIGDYFYWLAIPIMVERLTGSALLVGLSVISSALPMLVLGPIAGVFVDRWDRKRTMIVADILRALLVLLCLTVRTPEQVWVYYVVGFLMSCVSRFFFPSQNAVLPLIVPDKNDLLAANGLMQIVQTMGLLVGPALAGFSIGMWGEQVAFLVDSGTFILSALAISIMTVPRTTVGHQAAQGTRSELSAMWNELREGVIYLFGSRTMVGVLLCLGVVQLGLGAINVIWVPFMQRTFGLGPEGLGAVDTAQGLGMALGGIGLGLVVARVTKRQMAGWSIIFIGLMIALMGLAPSLSLATLFPALGADGAMVDMTVGQRLLHMPLALLLYSLLLGVALVPAQSALMTMMQLAVPDLKRGRVGSALNALTTAAGLVSMAVVAASGEVVGLRAIYVAAGAVIGVAGVVGLVVLEEPETVPEDEFPGREVEMAQVAAD